MAPVLAAPWFVGSPLRSADVKLRTLPEASRWVAGGARTHPSNTYGTTWNDMERHGTTWVCLKMLCTPFYPMVLLIIIPIKWL